VTGTGRDRRWRVRAEQALARPPMLPAMGQLRTELLALRAEASSALADADDRLRAAALDRLAAADRVRRSNRALAGTGKIVDRRTGQVIAQYGRPRAEQFGDPVPAASSLEAVRGEELRCLLVEMLELLARPASVGELVRLLAYHRFTTTGRASQTVANALAVEVRAGRVLKVGRGRYAVARSRHVSP
jgi:hypothetical protein